MSGLHSGPPFRGRPGSRPASIPILMYHSISHATPPQFRLFAVPPCQFEAQLCYLRDSGFTTLTISDLMQLSLCEPVQFPSKPVVLTFDDGFADFHEAALPLLTRYGMTATLYVTTGFVGGTSRWLQGIGAGQLPMMGWQQLRAVSQSGIEIGAHTVSHPPLDLIPLADARREIVESKATLESELGVTVRSFAYPFGYHSRPVRQLAAKAGFNSACAVGYAHCRLEADPLALTRHLVPGTADIAHLARLLAPGRVPAAIIARRIRSRGWAQLRHVWSQCHV